jgi:hypothetical protein
MTIRHLKWLNKVNSALFYSWKHKGIAQPLDLVFWKSILHHIGGPDLELWFQFKGGGPFVRKDWLGWDHLGPNIEAKALGQKKKRLRGRWTSMNGEETNRVTLRVPHR